MKRMFSPRQLNNHNFPTIADLCGVTVPKELASRSVRPLVQDPRALYQLEAGLSRLFPNFVKLFFAAP
jgi:hypothetical protein